MDSEATGEKRGTGEDGKIEVVTEIEAVKTYEAGWYRLIEFANSENLQLGESGFMLLSLPHFFAVCNKAT